MTSLNLRNQSCGKFNTTKYYYIYSIKQLLQFVCQAKDLMSL